MRRSIRDFVIIMCKLFILPVGLIISAFMLLFGGSAFLNGVMADYIAELGRYFILFILFYAYGLFLESDLQDTRPADETAKGFLMMLYTAAVTCLVKHFLKASELYIYCIPVYGLQIAGFWSGWYRVLKGFKAQVKLKYH